MSRSSFTFVPIAVSAVLLATACSQTPVIVAVRSMERPQDVDFICMQQLDSNTWKGVPLEKCALDDLQNPISATPYFRLHAVVTQLERGELASVDLGYSPLDPDGGQIVKVDPRLPGYTFLPVGAVPNDVTADPSGQAVYVASGRESRIDIIPAELLRGPIDTSVEDGEALPWPHLDFIPSDGAPTRLTIVRDNVVDPSLPFGAGRLYATLPSAVGGPKIAVFDLGDSTKNTALLPPRLPDIRLTFKESGPLAVQPVANGCGTLQNRPPWWVPLDVKCGGPAFTEPASIATPPYTETRLSGIVLVGGMLFAADDKAPIIHVFDLSTNSGTEIQRIPVGVATSRLSVSEPVGDEVTPYNASAIEICESKGWMGDGKDHTPREGVDLATTSGTVGASLGGRCRLHRYVYAVDFNDVGLGDGSVAVIDIPVSYGAGLDGKPSRALEKIAFDNESLVQPMACDSPAFPTKRIALGSIGIGGTNSVPASGVTFMRYDPPGLNSAKGVRCHPWDVPAPFADGDPFAQTSPDYLSAAIGWRDGIDPKRLRGTFGFVVLSNGVVDIIDIDDLDSLCRGPRVDDSEPVPPTAAGTTPDVAYFKRYFPSGSVEPAGPIEPPRNGAIDEYLRMPVRRHHPRSSRFYDVNDIPSVVNLTLSRGTNSLSFDSTSAEGASKPHLVKVNDSAVKPYLPNDLILPSADNPFSITTESWTVTYQGVLPGFSGTAGAFVDDDGTGSPALLDPAGAFCERGVDALIPDRHDLVQITEQVCDADAIGGPCTQATHDACALTYGIPDPTDPNQILPSTRDLVIGNAFDGKLTIAQHFEIKDGALVVGPGLPRDFHACFPGLAQYVVRARDTWVVIGTTTGYLHQIKADTTQADRPCVHDDTRSFIYNGRVTELPANTNLDTRPADCSLFVNPSWQFAIAQGFDLVTKVGVASARDMRFIFATRFNFSPLTVLVGSLPTAIRPVAKFRDGLDLLNWNQIATIDSIDRGLTVFNVADLNGRQTL